tara:strand:+ start:372 stop:656 length:285 start_codon:yes stop_codon:yes gene_type:complete
MEILLLEEVVVFVKIGIAGLVVSLVVLVVADAGHIGSLEVQAHLVKALMVVMVNIAARTMEAVAVAVNLTTAVMGHQLLVVLVVMVYKTSIGLV